MNHLQMKKRQFNVIKNMKFEECKSSPISNETLNRQKMQQVQYKNNPNSIDLLESYMKRIQVMSEEDRIKSIKDSQIGMVSAKYNDRPDPEPTYREIHQCLQMLELKIPEKDITKLIKMLHTNMLSTKTKCRQIQQQSSSLTSEKNNYINNQDQQALFKKAKKKRNSFDNKNYYVRDTFYSPKFMSAQDEIKFKQKRIVAQALCERQYGIQALEAEVEYANFTIPIQRYADLVTSVVTESFRRLEKFLIQQCRRNIRTLNRYQMSALYVPLCRCRDNFEVEQCVTFFKFITLVYGLDKVAITEQAAIKLYVAIQKVLITKIGEKGLDKIEEKKRKGRLFRQSQTKKIENQKEQFEKFWTKALYYDLIEWYLKEQLYSKVRVYFTKRFPTKDYLFTVQTLRSRLFKLLRMSIKKVAYYTEKYKKDIKLAILKLNGDVTRLILKCPNALNVRLLLVDIYRKDQCDVRQLRAIVKAINQYYLSWQARKSNQVIETAVPITNSKEKIDQNIALTNDKLREGFRKYGKEDIIIKEKQKNYQHIVQVEKGLNLHYYKKVDPNPLTNITTLPIPLDKIKQQEIQESKRLIIPNQQCGYNFCVRYADRDYVSERDKAGSQSKYSKNSIALGNKQKGQKQSISSDQSAYKKFARSDKQGQYINPLELRIKQMMQRIMGFSYPPINRK